MMPNVRLYLLGAVAGLAIGCLPTDIGNPSQPDAFFDVGMVQDSGAHADVAEDTGNHTDAALTDTHTAPDTAVPLDATSDTASDVAEDTLADAVDDARLDADGDANLDAADTDGDVDPDAADVDPDAPDADGDVDLDVTDEEVRDEAE